MFQNKIIISQKNQIVFMNLIKKIRKLVNLLKILKSIMSNTKNVTAKNNNKVIKIILTKMLKKAKEINLNNQ